MRRLCRSIVLVFRINGSTHPRSRRDRSPPPEVWSPPAIKPASTVNSISKNAPRGQMRATASAAAATSAKQECSQPPPEWVYKPSKMARQPCPFMPLLSYARHIEGKPLTCTLSPGPSRSRLPIFRILADRFTRFVCPDATEARIRSPGRVPL